MHVYLIHGMGRTPLSMWLLERRLRREGHSTSRFGYLVTISSLEDIASRFVEHISTRQAESAQRPYAIIGHSLGNVVARMASPKLPVGFERFVMLAPPNRSPRAARALSGNFLFRATTRDAGSKLADEEFFSTLPIPDVPALIIAGNRGPRSGLWPFDEANDMILKVAETRLSEIPVIEIPGFHTFLMNRYDVFDAINRFLRDPSSTARYQPAPSVVEKEEIGASADR